MIRVRRSFETNAKANNLIHPIRLRILIAISSRQVSTQQIAAYLPDVPQATLYRHIRAMTTDGILVLVDEHRVRGTMERIYTIAREKTELTQSEYDALTPQEHELMFSRFTAMLLSQFHNYVHQESFNLLKDGVGYRMASLDLSDSEFDDMMRELDEVVKSRLEYSLSPERRRRLFSFAVMPDVHANEPSSSYPTPTEAKGKLC